MELVTPPEGLWPMGKAMLEQILQSVKYSCQSKGNKEGTAKQHGE